MISWFERHNLFSWIITVVIGVVIFYLSSLTFAPSSGGGSNINSIIYHIFAFFFFSLFLLISLVKGKNKWFILLGIVFAVLYGISDEFHQFFVPGRAASVSDVLLDSLGVLFASMIYLISIEYRRKLG